jgi:hypothetical protein
MKERGRQEQQLVQLQQAQLQQQRIARQQRQQQSQDPGLFWEEPAPAVAEFAETAAAPEPAGETVSSASFGGKEMPSSMVQWVKAELIKLKGNVQFFDLMCYCNTLDSSAEVRAQMKHHMVRRRMSSLLFLSTHVACRVCIRPSFP